jgi:Flp pilus assembly protein TadB
MTALMIFGAGAGVGFWAIAVWLVPPRPTLGAELGRLTAPPATGPVSSLCDADGSPRIVRPVVAFLRSVGLPTAAMVRDLAVVERPIQDHLAAKAVLALVGLFVPSIAAVGLEILGVDLGVRVPAAAALTCAAIGFVLPDHRTRRQAAQRRTDFRHALSAFLDLVVISLAGGAGVDSALTDAASIGHGWAFTQIQRALAAARLTRVTPWTTLRQLGRDLDITELSELAASVSLAGTEGAKVRRSLHAKATALRIRQLTEAEGHAAADTERMSLPVMALFLGFLCFITYPAIGQVLNGL